MKSKKNLVYDMKEFFQRNKKSVRKFIGWCSITIFFMFVIPILINWAYATPAFLPIFEMKWQGADALNFYGSILGAAATIYVLRKTIKFTIDNQREERKLSIKPYLETYKYRYTDFEDLPTERNVVYLEVYPDVVTYQGGLPEDISLIIDLKNRGDYKENYNVKLDEVLYKAQMDNYLQEKYLLYYEISNLGAGNAINVNLKINDTEAMPSFGISTKESKNFVFILNSKLLEKTKDNKCLLKLSFEYSDVASLAKYVQTEEVIFCEKNGLNTVQLKKHLLTSPIEFKKNK